VVKSGTKRQRRPLGRCLFPRGDRGSGLCC